MTVPIAERMAHLRRIPIGANVHPASLREIAAHLHEEVFEPGDHLQRRGEPTVGIHLLVEGEVTLRQADRTVGRIAAPQTIGMLGTLGHHDAAYDAIAATRVRAFELETDLFRELLEDNFDLLSVTIRYLCQRLNADMRALPAEDLAQPSALDLVANRPLDWIERIRALRSMAGFRNASIRALSAMSDGLEQRTVPAGTVLWEMDTDATNIVFLLRGELRCEAPDREFLCGAGTAVGAVEALAREPHWYRAVAETDLTGLVGPAARILDLFEDEVRTGIGFLTMLARAESATIEQRRAAGHDPLAMRIGDLRVGA